MAAVYEFSKDVESDWGDEPSLTVNGATDDGDAWLLPVSAMVFDWNYYREKNGLGFATCREAYQHFSEQGLFSKLDPSAVVNTEFVLFWAHLNGQPIQTAEEFFGRLESTPADSEIGWSPRHDLESGLARTVRWYLDHAAWCTAIQSERYQRQRLGRTA